MSTRLLIAGAAIGALTAFSAAAYQPYPQPPADYPPAPAYGPPAYEPPPPADVGTPADTAYDEAPPPLPETAPVYVPGHSYYRGWVSPEDTSPAADFAIRLPSFANPTSSVTAAPNPNNVSDQVPSRGPDYDGVPPYVPY